MKKTLHFGALLCFILFAQFAYSQAGSTFTNPMVIGSLPYAVVGDSTCGYGDNYTTADIACTGSYMNGDEKIYSYTPTSSLTSFNVELTNISDTWSGIYITDDSTTAGTCLGNVGSSGTADRGVYGVSLVSGTTYYIIVSTWASPQCISSFDINMYSVTCPAPSALSVTNISYDSVVLGWTENGLGTDWEIEWDTNGFTPGTGNLFSTTLNPDTLSGLLQLTDYSYYVRTICGAGDSSLWIGPYNFTTLPTCPAPTALGASNIMTTSADLDWTENGSAAQWQVEWDTNGFTQGTGNINLTTANPYAISGLTPNTGYQFYVRAVCGAGDSSLWTGPFSFTTLCAPFIAPFTESFDNTSLPGCWDRYATTGGPWVFGNPGISWNTSGCSTAPTEHTGNSGNMASMDFSSTDVGVVLEMPVVDVSALTVPSLSFWYTMCNVGYTPTNKLFIEAWNGSSWAMVDSNVTGTSGWEKQTFDISAHTYGANLVWLRLRAESGGSSSDFYGDAGIDDVEINEAPTCPSPNNLSVTNILPNSAVVSWVENGSALLWEVEYDTLGFSPGTGVMDTTSLNPFSLSGLAAQTDYEFYVRAVCGIGDSSVWVGPLSFTTPCAIVVPQFFEPFDSFLPSICWEQAGDGTPATGPTGIGSSSWSQSGFPGTGAGGVRVNLSGSTKEEWILSPIFDLSTGGTYELKLEKLLATSTGAYSPMGSDDTVQVLISNDGGATWSAIHTWDSLNAPSTPASFEYIDLSAYSSANTQFAIWAYEGTVNDPESYYFYVGSFEIRQTPTCYEPNSLTASNIASNSADIGWVEYASATLWAYEYDTSGFALGTGTSDTTSANPYNLSGLNSNTTYEYYVRAICGAGDSSLWVGPYSFTTTPDTINTFPYTNDIESGLGAYLGLRDSAQSAASVDTIANNASTYGILLTGNTSSGWTGSSTSGTEIQAFVNSSTHISAIDMVVDATTVPSLNLAFDIKQTYTYGPRYSWARVTVNGTQVGASMNPTTDETDPFTTLTVDLSAYAGTAFILSIEHSGKYNVANGTGGRGDDAYIDNIELYVPVTAVTIVDSNVTCFGLANGGATVTASEGTAPYTYLWNNAATTASITNLMAGVYDVTVYDFDGDSTTSSVTITEPAMLVATVVVDSNVSCFGMADGGSSVSALGGTTPYAYAWSTMDTTMSVNGLTAGMYYVTVTDSNLCVTNDSVLITEPIAVTVDLGNDTSVCNQAALTLDAGASVNTYLWSDNSTAQTLNVPTATAGTTTYSVLVADASGCTATDSIDVTVFAPVVAAITGASDLCANESALLDAGPGFDTYLWSTSEFTQIIQANGASLQTGTQTFTVTVTDTNGCSGHASVSFEVFAPVVVDLGQDTAIIWFGSDTTFTLDAGPGFAAYLWTDGSTNQTNVANLGNQGNIVVVVTDDNGCTGTDTVVVDFILSVPTFDVSSLKMYPNPADDQVNVELTNFNNVKDVNITFLSITGEVVMTQHIQVSGNAYTGSFDVSHLAAGTYIVQFEANGEVVVKQFVIN